MQPVSYTHLDVYKRQEWKRYREVSKKLGEVVRKEGKQGAMAFLKQIHDSREFQQDQMIQLKMIPFIVLAEKGESVSYTHLTLHLDESGFRLVINNGPDAGEAVPHLHMHLLAGRKLEWPPRCV